MTEMDGTGTGDGMNGQEAAAPRPGALGTVGGGAEDGMRDAGAIALTRAAQALAARLPQPLAPFARLAYNYRWSWVPGGPDLFAAIDPYRWLACRENPVRLLQEVSSPALDRAAEDEALVARAHVVERVLADEARRSPSVGAGDHPVAFFCAEYGIHRSLPTYAGGLGVLAGDILKEASDLAVPMVGVGILYRQGYFHQRLDASGWQHEYWIEADPDRLPAALVGSEGGEPLTVTVPLRGRDVTVQVWRADVGSVALYLLDAHRPENSRSDRWITSRLYIGNRTLRLAQYALLGIGGVRALRAMGIDPAVLHLNEGHAALAPIELAGAETEAGRPFDEALAGVRGRTVFTTHTPVPAGNEMYSEEEIADVLGDLPARLGTDRGRLFGLARVRPGDDAEPFGLTPLGLRISRDANAVSERHGHVARAMWQPMYADGGDASPIGHVTNGVHLSTWMAPAMQALLDRYLPEGWRERQSDPAAWERVADIPDEELWAVRSELRRELVEYVRDRSVGDRLGRDKPIEYAEAAARAFDPEILTVGYARRVAGYKRLYLLVKDPQRARRLLTDPTPVQLVLAGKAHPQDELAKRILQGVFGMRWDSGIEERVAFLEDYDLGMATRLVRGCDLWINVPRAPLEASGTSGMKAVLNGGLNLSVLDGWWEEAWDGTNGWGIEADHALDDEAQDERDAAALYDLLESEVVPLFYDRDQGGVPRRWLERVKRSLVTIGPRFNARRMVEEYVSTRYRLG